MRGVVEVGCGCWRCCWHGCCGWFGGHGRIYVSVGLCDISSILLAKNAGASRKI